jgi:hypothetical protein
MNPIGPTAAKANMTIAFQALERSTTGLQFKARWLKAHRSNDPIQQMQTDAIIDLAEAVKQIQEALWPMSLLIPDVDAVREAAKAAAKPTPTPATAATTKLVSQISAFKR